MRDLTDSLDVADATTGTTDAELAETVHSAVTQHQGERGPLLVILHDLQQRLGHIPPAAIPLLAAELNLSRADVHGVVTFYHDFRSAPAGRTVVTICRAEACQSVGANQLVAAVEQRLGVALGGSTLDGAVTLEQVFCLGNCALGPSGQVNGRVHGRLDAARVETLVREARG